MLKVIASESHRRDREVVL